MLRTSLGAFDALLGGGLIQGITKGTRNRIPTPSTKPTAWTRALSSTTHSPPATQFWTARLAKNPLLRTARLRTPPGTRRPFQTSRVRRQTPQEPSPPPPKPSASLSLSQRLKKLSKEYGWTAVGVYLTLSVLDFPCCFLLVRIVGTEKIAAIEEIVITNVQKAIPQRVKDFWHNYRDALKKNEGETVVAEGGEVAVTGWGVEEARERKATEGASLATQLALAYAIHKSFIFVRVPLTAAILPKVVKVLRSFGWNIGTKAVKGAKAASKGGKL